MKITHTTAGSLTAAINRAFAGNRKPMVLVMFAPGSHTASTDRDFLAASNKHGHQNIAMSAPDNAAQQEEILHAVKGHFDKAIVVTSGATRGGRAKSRVAKTNTPPQRTLSAASKRGAALRNRDDRHVPLSVTAARLASKKFRVPGGAARKAKAKKATHEEMQRRRASLTAEERNAISAAAQRNPSGWKVSLSRSGRNGSLRGALASAFQKLGAGGVFSYPSREARA